MQETQQACIDACLRCLRDVERYLQACLVEAVKGKSLDEETLRVCRDCIEICSLAASLLLRNDLLSPSLCLIAAQLCQRCSQACRADNSHPLARQSGHSAEACAESCRTFASTANLQQVLAEQR